MKSLKVAIILSGWVWLGVPAVEAQGFDLPSITTGSGRSYHEIFILTSDAHGLLFRHRDGIAKLPFAQLSENLRMLYEPVEEVDPGIPEELPEEEAESDGFWDGAVVTLTARSRIEVPVSALTPVLDPWGSCSCLPWRSHWPRYTKVPLLAYPSCRAAAVRDFLRVTELDQARGWVAPHGFHPGIRRYW